MKPLEQGSIIPLYYQVKQRLDARIKSGEWRPGDKIDSENQLMTVFNVSRNTAKKAIEEMVQEGTLFRIQGKGTFVSHPKFEQSLGGFYSFSQVLKEKGFNPSDIVIEVDEVEPPAAVIEGLQLAADENVVMMKRVRCADGEPIILEASYMPKSIVQNKEDLFEVGVTSLYGLLASRYGVTVVRAKEAFEPVLIREQESEYLKTEVGKPALLLERTAYDTHDTPVEFCISIVRGDRCRFYTDLV
ncbi:GntR family transcriptional regulator [Sporosarcina gallistercoris]|uniref:GntR family transcriptional regulator n=1 Tax=Sporosarcina gallistercoris TaxID=2762245 RepID=A0ABR8PJH8_9BACL|nr:GntR family transcriptional regulator [Sporosarcina gallistercoris]MBD7908229.1 GntR family transcriptional regulator [Sporosarcina gallistercoris]